MILDRIETGFLSTRRDSAYILAIVALWLLILSQICSNTPTLIDSIRFILKRRESLLNPAIYSLVKTGSFDMGLIQ